MHGETHAVVSHLLQLRVLDAAGADRCHNCATLFRLSLAAAGLSLDGFFRVRCSTLIYKLYQEANNCKFTH